MTMPEVNDDLGKYGRVYRYIKPTILTPALGV